MKWYVDQEFVELFSTRLEEKKKRGGWGDFTNTDVHNSLEFHGECNFARSLVTVNFRKRAEKPEMDLPHKRKYRARF